VTRLALYSRAGCGLCEEMLAELAPWAADRGLAIQVLDVDTDVTLRRRYGLRIPVLALDGDPVCIGRLDLGVLERRLL
jgi:Glutaredoxin-like domain (DUF836)